MTQAAEAAYREVIAKQREVIHVQAKALDEALTLLRDLRRLAGAA